MVKFQNTGKTKKILQFERRGTSLAVQWLRLRNFTAGGAGSIPGQGTKILHAMQFGWGNWGRGRREENWSYTKESEKL